MAIFNNTIYLAGQVPGDATQDIRGQTRQVLATIDKLLTEAGTDNAHILMAQIFLARPGRLRRHERSVDDWSRRATRRRAPPCSQARQARMEDRGLVTAAISAGPDGAP